jgi:hypothetical protein
VRAATGDVAIAKAWAEAPAGTVTDASKAALAELLDSSISRPPAGAGLVR